MAPVNKDKALGIKVMKSEARLLIAVVDDDTSAGKALGRLLCAFGLHAETFVSGSEFLKWLQNHAPHCVVLDQNMPHMDGLQATAHIMTNSPRPIVIVSSESKEGAASTLKALELGAIDFVAKPSAGIDLDMQSVKEELLRKVRVAAKVRVVRTASRLANAVQAPPKPGGTSAVPARAAGGAASRRPRRYR